MVVLPHFEISHSMRRCCHLANSVTLCFQLVMLLLLLLPPPGEWEFINKMSIKERISGLKREGANPGKRVNTVQSDVLNLRVSDEDRRTRVTTWTLNEQENWRWAETCMGTEYTPITRSHTFHFYTHQYLSRFSSIPQNFHSIPIRSSNIFHPHSLP